MSNIMRSFSHLARLFIALCASFFLANIAIAQNYPNKSIRLIVPFPPGGATDAIMRLVAQKLSDKVGQQIIVDNIPGAGTIIATGAGARAAPDGYTMIVVTGAYSANPSLYNKIPYRNEDLVPVTEISSAPQVLVINPSLPANNLEEYIKYAKEHPKMINFGSAGNGTSNHLTGEMLKSMAGVSIVHIPYKGDAPAITDLIAGQIQSLFVGWAPIAQHVKSGKLKALAVTSASPSALVPGLPPVASVVSGFESSAWNGLVMPPKTPAAIVDFLRKEISVILAQSDVKEKIREYGYEPVGSSQVEFGQFLRNEEARMAKIITQSNIKIE